MRQIAVYGKGGIGKSTVTQNVAAALAESGRKILLTGCDPKADSTRLLTGSFQRETVMEQLLESGEELTREQMIRTGFCGIDTVESGGPEPGVGCAGRGISLALMMMERAGIREEDYDYVFYDVLGDVVCGGFAAPIRDGKAKEIYIVCSGELMSLFAANNICRGIAHYASGGEVRLGGLICNGRDLSWEQDLVREFADRIQSVMIGWIPKNRIVQLAEMDSQTVLEYAPDHAMAGIYRDLAGRIEDNTARQIPQPLTNMELEELVRKYLV